MKYLDLDFIEIGASKFGTLIENCEENAVGISIEPIISYLNQLPNKKNVIKVNVAITGDDVGHSKIKLYYIPEEVIVSENLDFFFIGCNKIGDYHPLHIRHNLKHLVKIEEVELVGIGCFLYENKVRRIKYLQIDTEGHDTNIMIGLYAYLSKLPDEFHPLEIKWETNIGNCTKEQTDIVVSLYFNLGYFVSHRNDDGDTIIKKS
jgi:hypothetical protein